MRGQAGSGKDGSTHKTPPQQNVVSAVVALDDLLAYFTVTEPFIPLCSVQV